MEVKVMSANTDPITALAKTIELAKVMGKPIIITLPSDIHISVKPESYITDLADIYKLKLERVDLVKKLDNYLASYGEISK